MTFSFARSWLLVLLPAAALCFPLAGHAQQVVSPVPLPRQSPSVVLRPPRTGRVNASAPAPALNFNRRARRHRPPPKPVIEFVPGGTVSSAPVFGPNGIVYLASWNCRVYALDSMTGALKWKFTAPKMFNASPVVGTSGTVYAGAYDGKVYALDGETGAKKWEFATRALLNATPALSASGDTVYVGGHDRTVYALASDNGAVKWRTLVGAAASSPAVDKDGAVYVGADKIYALKPGDGTTKWQFPTGYDAASPVAAGDNGLVYAQAHDSAGRSQICALDDRTGRQLWAYPLAERMAFPPVSSDGRVYVGADQLYALRQSSGHLVWQYGQGGVRWSTPTVYQGIVCAGSGSGQVVALDAAKGDVLWTFATNDPLLSFPRFGPRGIVYVACEGDRKVYALQGRTGKVLWQFTQDPLPVPAAPSTPRRTKS